jgi:ubiquinone/menaquinone biosynthesis C-methylase UbiE
MTVASRIHTVLEQHGSQLGDNALRFAERIFSKSLDVYTQRLRGCGFVGARHVLDAGCGFGQWSLALAGLNTSVEAIDVSGERLRFLRDAASALDLANIQVQQCGLEHLCYRDAAFDAVFCYGVLFLTRWRQSLTELARVVAPGGRIYVNANGIGWYKHLWYNAPHASADYDPRHHAAIVLHNTWRYQKGLPTDTGLDILIEPDELEAEMANLGFVEIHRAAEGHIGCMLGLQSAPEPFFAASYLGDLGVYEMVATKSDHSRGSEA